jgi:hypothetical protein
MAGSIGETLALEVATGQDVLTRPDVTRDVDLDGPAFASALPAERVVSSTPRPSRSLRCPPGPAGGRWPRTDERLDVFPAKHQLSRSRVQKLIDEASAGRRRKRRKSEPALSASWWKSTPRPPSRQRSFRKISPGCAGDDAPLVVKAAGMVVHPRPATIAARWSTPCTT